MSILKQVQVTVVPWLYDGRRMQIRAEIVVGYDQRRIQIVKVVEPNDFMSYFDLVWRDTGKILQEAVQKGLDDADGLPECSDEDGGNAGRKSRRG